MKLLVEFFSKSFNFLLNNFVYSSSIYICISFLSSNFTYMDLLTFKFIWEKLVYKFSLFFRLLLLLLPLRAVLLLLCLLRLFNSSFIIEFSNSRDYEYSYTLLYSFSSDPILTKYFISLCLKFSTSSLYLFISSTNYWSIYKLFFNKLIFTNFIIFLLISIILKSLENIWDFVKINFCKEKYCLEFYYR